MPAACYAAHSGFLCGFVFFGCAATTNQRTWETRSHTSQHVFSASLQFSRVYSQSGYSTWDMSSLAIGVLRGDGRHRLVSAVERNCAGLAGTPLMFPTLLFYLLVLTFSGDNSRMPPCQQHMKATTTGHEAEKSGQMARWLRSNITEQYDNNWHFYPDTLDFSLLIASHRWSLSGNSWRSGELWLSLSGRVAKWTHCLNEVQSKQHMTALLSLNMHMTTGLLPCMAWKVGCIIMSGFKVGPKRRRHDSPLAHRPTAAEWGAFMALPGPEGGWNGQVVPWDEIHKTSLELSPVPLAWNLLMPLLSRSLCCYWSSSCS